MFFYTVIQNKKDGTIPTSTVIKNTYDDACEQMHYDMWYALNQKNLFNSVMCLIINEMGNVEKKDSWERSNIYYIVSFDVNGGLPEPEAQTVLEDDLAIEPEQPSKEGYTFMGWLLNNEVYDFSTPITSNIILVASWQEN